MKALISPSTGVCILNERQSRGRIFCAIPDIIADNEDYLAISSVNDWQIVASDTERDLLETVYSAYYSSRVEGLIQECLRGLPPDLERDVLAELDEHLQGRSQLDLAVSRLLIAPLRDPDAAQRLATTALSHGYALMANLVEQVRDLQPLLKRFVSAWLQLADAAFEGVSRSKPDLWHLLTSSGVLSKLLMADGHSAFTAAWNSLAFYEGSATGRSALVRLGSILATSLEKGRRPQDADCWVGDGDEIPEPSSREDDERHEHWHVRRDRALKQVRAITEAASGGEDEKARRFLAELVSEQRASPEHAVKSLCNIAKQCADMFRTDLEGECLHLAAELLPTDDWTLIQLGDHYKRVGDFGAAIRVLENARFTKDRVIAESSIADVFSQQGEYERAIATYTAIPNWASHDSVRTAVADNLRRMGELDEAEKLYDALLADGCQSDRVIAGRAEIARRRGDLARAAEAYEDLVRQQYEDERSLNIYRLSLATLYKQMSRLDDGFRLLDAVIGEVPFHRRARILRASILGLRGEAVEALAAIPMLDRPHAFGEWVHHYYRGLLLLKLDRFADAKTELLSNLDSALLQREDRAILRLAAALMFLSRDQYVDANGILDAVPPIKDKYAEYLATVLRFHIAVAKQDRERISALAQKLKQSDINDADLSRARELIVQRQFTAARRLGPVSKQ